MYAKNYLEKNKSKELINKIENDLETFSKNENKTEIILQNINSSKDRYEIYEITKRLNLIAESFMYPNSTNKFIIVKKKNQADLSNINEYNTNKITTDFINFFVKFTEIPIPTNHPDHFYYFVENLDEYFDCKKYLEIIEGDIKLFDPENKLERKYFSLYKKQLWNLKEKIKEIILKNKEYQTFIDTTKNELLNLPDIVTSNDIYSENNIGKILISVDVRTANFRVLKHYCPSLFEGVNEWCDFVAQHTEHKFPLISKPFRTILFNELSGLTTENENNRKNHKFPIIFIDNIIEEIKKSKFCEILNIECIKNDEVIFEILNFDIFSYADFCNFVNNSDDLFKVQIFKLSKITNENYYVKEFLNENMESKGKVEFKNVPKKHIMQIVKKYKSNFCEVAYSDLDFKYVEENGNIYVSDKL